MSQGAINELINSKYFLSSWDTGGTVGVYSQ